MMYCRQFGEPNRKGQSGAQLEPWGVAQKQVVAAHQEEAGEDQVVQVHHLDLRHQKVCSLQEQHFQCKNTNKDRKYVKYAVYAKYGSRYYMQNMQNMTNMHNMTVID